MWKVYLVAIEAIHGRVCWMKINQVEELVGITKKNIRFYESQGLLNPGRNPENSYRDYNLQDVEQLNRIKLLRKLDIPCEEIRRIMSGEISLQECVRDQEQKLEKRCQDMAQMQEFCVQLSESGSSFDSLKASSWLDRMKDLEKGGTRFVDTRESDVKQRRLGSLVWAGVSIAFMGVIIWIILWGNSQEPLPIGLLLFLLLIPVAVIIGVVIALLQRMKELDKGELYEASKY